MCNMTARMGVARQTHSKLSHYAIRNMRMCVQRAGVLYDGDIAGQENNEK